MATVQLSARKPGMQGESKLLVGWKTIAGYLGLGVRTIQRYEREHGLPVRRPAGGPRGAVIATVAELDAWVQATPIRDFFRLAATKKPTSTFEELQAGMKKMQSLCAEIKQLRTEMKASMDTLHSTIHDTSRAGNLHRTHESLERIEKALPTDIRRLH